MVKVKAPIIVWDHKLTIATLCFLVAIVLLEVTRHFKEKFVDEAVPMSNPFRSFHTAAATSTSSGELVNEQPLFIFADNKCDPSCCGNSDLSCSHGCVCKTKEQETMMGTRGYNNTKSSEY
jgi:hypothetical protein